jgi:dTDP-4-amino-4,6-dideoxygalactose transaminase
MAKLAFLGGNSIIPAPGKPQRSLFVGGPEKEFVEKFTQYCGCNHALCFCWGTAALTAAMVAAEVGPGDEVIVPSFTWCASVNPILHVNAIPIFGDVDPKTYTLDPEDVRKKITPRTKVILPVDYYGHPANIPEIVKIAKSKGILVVQDSCQATGAEIHGKKVGSIADITAFSFSGKPIAASSGGVLTTNSEHFYERAMIAGEHTSFLCLLKDKELRDYFTPTLGYGFKGRIDYHAAEIGLKQLETLDERNNLRIENCNFMTDAFRQMPGLTPPYVAPGFKHVYHFYTVLYNEQQFGVPRSLFCDALMAEGLMITNCTDSGNSRLFSGGGDLSIGPIHRRPVFQKKNLYGKGCPFKCPLAQEPDYENLSLPVTERLVKQEINFHQRIITPPKTKKEMQTYIDIFDKVIKNIGELQPLAKGYTKNYLVEVKA